MTIIQYLEAHSLKYTHQQITIREALVIYSRSHVDFDRQRWGGISYHPDTGQAKSRGAGWDIKKGKEYVRNVFLSLNLNQIVAVDLQSVIAHCELYKLPDVEYFKKIASMSIPNDEIGKDPLNTKYLIEDGHNTLSYLHAFVDGRFTVMVPSEKKDQKFNQLPDELQEYFLSKKLSIKLVIGSTVNLLHENIISVNSSKAWERQDCRNAYTGGNIATFVRRCADLEETNNTRQAFSCVLGKADAEKRETDKLFAQHLMYEHAKVIGWEGRNIADPELDSLYYNIKNINEKLRKSTNSILSTMAHMLKDQSSKSMKKGRWSNMWLFISNCIENVYNVKDHKAVLDAYFDFLWKIEAKEGARGWTDFERETESFENASYFYSWRKRVAKERDSEGVLTQNKKTVMTWKLRENTIKTWFATVETDLIEKGAISKIRKSKDAYSKRQKQAMFTEGHVDSDIAASDVFSQIKHIEADHIIPVAQGGPTTPDNGRLITRKANRAKGAKLNEAL